MATEKEVVRFGPFAQAIASGVRVGDTIYLSGQVSVDDEGGAVGEGDMVAQVRQAYVNVKDVLSRFGATMANVVDETWFVTDMDAVTGDLEGVFGARAEAFGGTPETTQTLIRVSGLFMPELLVEIKCVAHL
jgi:enamine deaminase RidA (YjgF/YER057c/UK114 family)